jgi:signal peptidase II
MRDVARWVAISIAVIIVDQLTKLAIRHFFAPGAALAVTPFFDLVLVFNRGAAFSLFARASGWQHAFFIAVAAVAVVVIVILLLRHRRQTWFCVALALILGGAIGNVIDRVSLGAVVDFLYFHIGPHYWPAFNVADSAITCGALLLIWDSFRQRHRTGEAGGPR